METILNYIYENLNKINIFKEKEEELNILCDINFDNTDICLIINNINNIKYSKSQEQIYKIKLYYEDIYNKDPFDNLSKLKYKIILYLDCEKDKTENIFNEINKYKDPVLVNLEKRFNKLKQDIEYDVLEKRFNELKQEENDTTNEDNNNEDDNEDDDNNNTIKVLVKQKIQCQV